MKSIVIALRHTYTFGATAICTWLTITEPSCSSLVWSIRSKYLLSKKAYTESYLIRQPQFTRHFLHIEKPPHKVEFVYFNVCVFLCVCVLRSPFNLRKSWVPRGLLNINAQSCLQPYSACVSYFIWRKQWSCDDDFKVGWHRKYYIIRSVKWIQYGWW